MLEQLADEQAVLRRVAELVALGADPTDVFTAVAAEASHLHGNLGSVLVRYDPDGTALVVATCNSQAPVGHRTPTLPGTAFGEVLRTGRPVRDDGAGGADPSQGSGLTGLLDRIEASSGTLVMTSPAGSGTTVHATLPIRLDASPRVRD